MVQMNFDKISIIHSSVTFGVSNNCTSWSNEGESSKPGLLCVWMGEHFTVHSQICRKDKMILTELVAMLLQRCHMVFTIWQRCSNIATGCLVCWVSVFKDKVTEYISEEKKTLLLKGISANILSVIISKWY